MSYNYFADLIVSVFVQGISFVVFEIVLNVDV